MTLSFLGPSGAVADVKELEYISALHQTCSGTDESFVDGSIDAEDIKYYLMSRHGIDVTEDHVRKVILRGLGGGESEDDCLDIAELVAVLIIPALLSVTEEQQDDNDNDTKSGTIHKKTRSDFMSNFAYRNYVRDMEELRDLRPSPTLIADVLRIILINVTGSSEPPVLTKELLVSIFTAYDEIELLQNDDLMEEMMRIAGGGEGGKPDARLDAEAFGRALTEDVQKCESKFLHNVSTCFEDAFGGSTTTMDNNNNNNNTVVFAPVVVTRNSPGSGTAVDDDDDMMDRNEKGHLESVQKHDDDDDGPPPQKIFTFASADFTAETYRSNSHTISVFFAVPLVYYNFIFSSETNIDVCNDEEIWCKILRTVLDWVILMLILSIGGSIYLAGLSLGNHKTASFFENVVGILCTFVFTILPSFIEFDLYFITNSRPASMVDNIMKYLLIVVGVFIMLNQFFNICKQFIPERTLQGNQFLGFLMKGSEAKAEMAMKQAAAFKVNNMIKNAYKLHFDEDAGDVTETQLRLRELKSRSSETNLGEVSTHSKALLNYTNTNDVKEEIGGFFWAWKEFFSGDLLDRHGIWIHNRLLAANILQIVVLVVAVVLLATVASDSLTALYPPEDPESAVAYESCVVMFNSTLCELPPLPLGGGALLGVAACFNVDIFPLVPGGCDNFFQPIPDEYQGQMDLMCDVLADGADAMLAEVAQESDVPSFVSDVATAGLGNLNFRDQCPDLYYSDYYAILTGSNDVSSCAAAVSACAIFETGNVTKAHCVLGYDNINAVPGSFYGEMCQEDALIATVSTIDDVLPKKWMINLSFGVGFTIVILSITSLIIILIPSTVASVLKFRTGYFETLKHPNFNIYRSQIEDVSYLLGIMFWGMLFSSILLFASSAGVTFLLVWQVTRPYVIRIISAIAGICITLVFRTILIKSLGKFNYAGFYRKRPMVGNIATLALEFWHIALTVGFMAARVVKIMVCAAFYIGRVDTPVLAEGGIGDKLDKFPHVFRKEVLSTEAHRHPYIERLGFMYLMKLRHGDDFGKLSGSIWRLLFVFALMPWLRKYRIQSNDEDVIMQILLDKLALKVLPTGPTEDDTIKQIVH